MIVESVETECFFSRYKSTYRRHKLTKHVFPLLKKGELVTQQIIVHQSPFSEEEQFSTNHSHPLQKKLNWVQIWNERICFLLADDLSNIFIFQIISINFTLLSTSQIYSQIRENQDLLSLQKQNTVDFGLRSWFSSFEQKGSIWEPYNH